MKKSILALTFASTLTAFSGAAFAQDSFNSQIGYGGVDADGVNVHQLTGSYFLNSVDTNKGPLGEATFLDKQSELFAAFTHFDTDPGGANSLTIGGSYVFGNSGFFVDAAYSKVNGFDADSFVLGGGYYLTDDWTVSALANINDDKHLDSTTIASKKLFDLGGSQFLSLEGSFTNENDGYNSYGVEAEYYVNRNLSFTASYEGENGTSTNAKGIGVNWYVTDNIAVGIGAIFTNDDDDAYTFGASARF